MFRLTRMCIVKKFSMLFGCRMYGVHTGMMGSGDSSAVIPSSKSLIVLEQQVKKPVSQS